MGIEIGGKIERVNGKKLTYDEFVGKYLAKNQPVVLTGLMDDWRACEDWVTENGCPNLHFFSTHFANSKVQVADCGVREFTDQKRVEMTVKEFIDNWIESNASRGDSKSVLYLKDWHFVKGLGLLFMLMFSGHTVGQQMFVGRRNGFFCLLPNVI